MLPTALGKGRCKCKDTTVVSEICGAQLTHAVSMTVSGWRLAAGATTFLTGVYSEGAEGAGAYPGLEYQAILLVCGLKILLLQALCHKMQL